MTKTAPVPRVNMPKSAALGETMEIKTQIAHRMETGFRRDTRGFYVRRKIINRFEVDLDDEPVLRVDLDFAMSRDPLIGFFVKAERSGTYRFRWIDDDGSVYRHEAAFTLA